MVDMECMKGSLNPKRLIDLILFKIRFAREHPFFFYPCGIEMFCGPQGAGKTLSSVLYVDKLLKKYPKAKMVTNLNLTDYPIITFDDFKKNKTENYKNEDLKLFYKKLLNLELFDFEEFYFLYKSDVSFIEEIDQYLLKLKSSELIIDTEFYNDVVDKFFYYYYLSENRVFLFINNDDFLKYKNGEYGIIYFVDEIQLYLNSLESKNINMDVITQLSQQRKQRSHIVCTSQVFGRMAKPLREQFSEIIYCKKYFSFLQINSLIDRDSIDGENSSDTNISGEVIRKFFNIHSPSDFGKYDTYSVVQKGKFVSGEKTLNIYNNSNDNENKG